jgi:hypothetical protein
MASVVALDQWSGGIVWDEVKEAPRSALATLKQGLSYRIGQWGMTVTIARSWEWSRRKRCA